MNTFTLSPLICNSRFLLKAACLIAYFFSSSVNAQVNLTATSGTASGTYTTLKAAFDAINAGTHQGSIAISIVGNTTETASAALNASGSGSASYSSISISPSGGSKRTISGNIAGHLINLNGADNVTIDGLNTGGDSLTFSNANTSNGAINSTICFQNGATYNIIKNCTITGTQRNTATGVLLFYLGGNSFNTIRNNNFTNDLGQMPVSMIYSSGTAGNSNINNDIIENNFYDFFNLSQSSFGINILSNSSDWTISNNSFY